MREDNLSVYHCFIESTRTHTCMREENLSVYHCFIEALGHIHVSGRRTLEHIIVLLKH
jgi:hypothetical protein